MIQKRLPRAWFAVGVLAVLSGCSTTKLTDSWQAPTLHRSSMDNVLVVAVSANAPNRILFERGFVKALQKKGIRATASYDVLGDAIPIRDTVVPYVAKNNIPYVIAVRYGGSEVTHEVVPASVRTYYSGPYYPSYYGYWEQSSVTMTQEAYVDQMTSVLLTTSIYDVKSGELVWAGRSKSFDVASIAYEADSVAQLVVDNIKN
jgi:hypothetical protein